MEKYDGWTIQNCYGRTPWLVFGFAERTRREAIADFELLWGKGAWRKERRKGNYKLVKVKLVEVDKMERKKTVLLTLIDDWEKLCKKSLSKLNVKKHPYVVGFIRGELRSIVIMRGFITEAWRQ